MKKLLLLFLVLIFSLSASDNIYLTGDNLKSSCDHLFDYEDTSLDPLSICDGDTVYVVTPLLDTFFKGIHPYIKNPYILVTHDDDNPIPGEYGSLLSDDKVIAWFAQNVQKATHPKLHPLPIGIPNKRWWCGDIAILNKKTAEPPKNRDILLYMNFNIDTNREERQFVYNIFKSKPYCLKVQGRSFEEYLDDLQRTQFVLSPRGHGLDCHRTWECLLMGAIPIVKTSDLDPQFENLPVLIVNNWKEISPRFLRQKYAEMQLNTYQMEKIFLPYWVDQIEQTRRSYLSKKQ